MKRNLEDEIQANMESNGCEPFFDQLYNLNGFVQPFLLRSNPDEGAWYRGWQGLINYDEPWVLITYWYEGSRLFTYISHPEFLLEITHKVLWLIIENKKGQ